MSTVEAHLCGTATVWIIKNQKTVSLGTTELELNAISQAVRQALHMRKLCELLQILTNFPIQIDNNHSAGTPHVACWESSCSSGYGLCQHQVKVEECK